MSHRTVRETMTAEVVTVGLDTPAKDIAELLHSRAISGVPVLDDAREVIGVVSEADLMHKIAYQDLVNDDEADWRRLFHRYNAQRVKATGATANDLMTAPAVTILPDESIVDAAARMDHRRIKRLPVVDGVGELVGIISRRDLIRIFVRPDEEIRTEVAEDVIKRALLLSPVDVVVEVVDGIVLLRGRLPRRSEVRAVVELSRRVDGVISVVDDLTYLEDDYVYAGM